MEIGKELGHFLFGWKIEQGKGSEVEPGKFGLEAFQLNGVEKRIALSSLKIFFAKPELELSKAIQIVCNRDFALLSTDSAQKVTAVCSALANGFGPLDPLLANGEIEEISVAGVGKPVRAYVIGKGWRDTALVFTSEECIYHFANKLAQETGRRLTLSNPVLNAFLPNGSRLHVVSGQISAEPSLTLRKFRSIPFTLPELVERGTISNQVAEFLSKAVANGSSILVAGNTGSGKTTLLNSLLSTLPGGERFVMAEDVSEISLPNHDHKIRLLADTAAGINLNQLIYESLRMRPDRLVISEVRNEEEVNAFANALLSGPGKSCFTTFHANSASEALRRLQLLGFRSADLNSIGLIVVQRRFGNGAGEKRRVTEIAAVKNGKAVVLFQYSPAKDKLVLTSAGKVVLNGISC